jgi:hypothetical protein
VLLLVPPRIVRIVAVARPPRVLVLRELTLVAFEYPPQLRLIAPDGHQLTFQNGPRAALAA